MDGVVIPTDQPIADGGDGSAPSPLSYFLASMGTLFLVGNGLNREVLQKVGIRPLAQGAILWIVVSAAVLIAVSGGIIH